MASTTETTPSAPAVQPEVELPINTKPAPTSVDEKEAPECTCEASMPKLARQDSIDSMISLDADYRRPPRRARPNYIRRYSPSPIRIRQPPIPIITTPLLNSSTSLLDYVSKHDGMIDLPFPSRGSIYLTTYPFTNKDVKKWSWLFSLNVEETFLQESSRGRTGRDGDLESGEDMVYPVVRRQRNRSPFFDPGTIDLPSVYLSRALDKEVVPEDTANVSYLIVTQNRHRPAGSKLMVAESRKAAGIVMYYEALKGDSTVFVGAVVGMGEKKVHPKKFRKVENLEEAAKVKEEGLVGVIC